MNPIPYVLTISVDFNNTNANPKPIIAVVMVKRRFKMAWFVFL